MRLPVEGIVVAAVAKVEEDTSGGEEVEGGLCIGVEGGSGADALLRPGFGFFEEEEECEPGCQIEVAEAAGTLLDVGLEMEDSVAVLGVAGASEFAELVGDGVPFAENCSGKNVVVELLVERITAGEEAMIKSGE